MSNITITNAPKKITVTTTPKNRIVISNKSGGTGSGDGPSVADLITAFQHANAAFDKDNDRWFGISKDGHTLKAI